MTPIMIRNEFPSLHDRTPAWRAHRLAIHLQRQSWVQLFFTTGQISRPIVVCAQLYEFRDGVVKLKPRHALLNRCRLVLTAKIAFGLSASHPPVRDAAGEAARLISVDDQIACHTIGPVAMGAYYNPFFVLV